jgi:hypothetical protein
MRGLLDAGNKRGADPYRNNFAHYGNYALTCATECESLQISVGGVTSSEILGISALLR